MNLCSTPLVVSTAAVSVCDSSQHLAETAGWKRGRQRSLTPMFNSDCATQLRATSELHVHVAPVINHHTCNLQGTDCHQLDHAVMLYFWHLLGLPEKVLHLLAVVTMPCYEVTHWIEGMCVCMIKVNDVCTCYSVWLIMWRAHVCTCACYDTTVYKHAQLMFATFNNM